jgi:hypothetical protein
MAAGVRAAVGHPSGGRCFVLVAKALTKSDTAGRVILPRVSVETNLSFLMGYRSEQFLCEAGLHSPSDYGTCALGLGFCLTVKLRNLCS